MQLEGGASWSDVLERQLAIVKRALKRDSGHEARAKEFNPENITQGVPTRTAWAYGWAVVWMLGCVQLVHLKVTDIRLNFAKKTVTLNIKKSKMGQEALGVKRTLRCCNNTSCLRLCPWRPWNMVTRIPADHANPSEATPFIPHFWDASPKGQDGESLDGNK